MNTITVNTKALLKELTWANRFIEKNIPILANAKLRARNGSLTITGTDLEVAGIAGLSCSMAEPDNEWAITIPSPQACKVLALVESDTVELSTKSDTLHCRIAWDGGHSSIQGMDAANFPELPPTMPAPATKILDIRVAAKRVATCISPEESRFTLNGARIEVKEDGSARLVATDGHRLALADLSVEDPAPYTGLISKFALLEAASMNGGSVLFGGGKVGVLDPEAKQDERPEYHTFLSGNRIILARALTGSFPDWQRVFPSPDSIVDAVPLPSGFAKALRRVDLFTAERSRAFRMTVVDDELTLYAEASEKGSATEVLRLDGDHAAATVGLNATYVMDFLALVGKDETTIWKHCGNQEGKDTITRASILEIPGFQMVVMPMRI